MNDSDPEPTGPEQPLEVVYGDEDDGFANGILSRAADDLNYRRQALDQAHRWVETGQPVTTCTPGTAETAVVLTPTQANGLVEDLEALPGAVRQMDPRSVVEETDYPQFLVTFWADGGTYSDEWLLTGCDISAVIRWARQHLRDGEEVVLKALVPSPLDSHTYHGIRLEGWEPSDTRPKRRPFIHLPRRT